MTSVQDFFYVHKGAIGTILCLSAYAHSNQRDLRERHAILMENESQLPFSLGQWNNTESG